MSSSFSSSVSALILAGGRGTRVGGAAKHALVFEGRSILDRQLDVLRPRVSTILISSNAPIDGFDVIADEISDAGPLAGVAAGLAKATTEWMLVVPCDLPLLSGELVDAMLAARASEAVGVRAGDLPEPLLCVLRVAAVRPVLEARLAAKRYKASGLLTDEKLAVSWLSVDPASPALHNVNRLADLR